MSFIGTTGIDNSLLFKSELEIPDGNNPGQNAWLTITIRYKLNFVDGWNDKAGLTVEKGGAYFAMDYNKKLFPIIPWDALSMSRFRNDFQRGEKIWNFRFLLITPQDYTGLDYQSVDRWLVRPNVLCLFRLVPDHAKPHLRIDVVRLDPSIDSGQFRSSTNLYDNMDLYRPTFGHELGHALGLKHIKALLGDQQCNADQDAHRCYGETEWEKATIMGSGGTYTLLFAKPWLDRIAEHTKSTSEWKATMETGRLPRKISQNS
jgi:hypothetical protein